MLDFLKKLKDDPEGPFDAIFFMPSDKEGQVHIEANQLKGLIPILKRKYQITM